MSEKLLAKPDICRCKRSVFTKILPRNASLRAAAIKQSHASGQDFARVLPGPAPPWGPGTAEAHQGDRQGRTPPQTGSRAAGDSWIQPRVQIIGHLCGGEVGPRSRQKFNP